MSPPTLLQYFLLRGEPEMRGWGQEGVGCVVSPKLVLAKGEMGGGWRWSNARLLPSFKRVVNSWP